MISIDGYDQFELIGRGGFASVHKARQLSIGRHVAIKVLSDPTPDADLVRRFERESRAVGALSWHPNIGAVVDAGTADDGRAYIAFELLTGGSLADQIEHDPMPWPDAVAAMIQIADAVEAAHRADVLHRDIKPANIMLDRLGDAKLVDFGIASMQDGTHTETGMLVTTIAHAAPELFDGDPASVATDVYALGSTLFTLIAGHPPFRTQPTDTPAAIMRRSVTEAPPPLASPTPPQVSGVVLHALAKQPDHRPRSAAAFGAALQHAQADLGLDRTRMRITDGARRTDPAPGATPHAADALLEGSPDEAAPFSKTIAALAGIAAILGALVAGALLFNQLRDDVVATTTTGIELSGLTSTDVTFVGGFPATNAIDADLSTLWVVQANETGNEGEGEIVGSVMRMDFKERQVIRSLGIDHGETPDDQRIAAIGWTTDLTDFAEGDGVVAQRIDVEDGDHTIDVEIVTDRLYLVITDVHSPESGRAALAEVLVSP